MRKIFLFFTLCLFTTTGMTQKKVINGRQIMTMVKNRPNGETRQATTEMILIKKNGRQRIRKIVSWAMDIGNDTKKIMFFTYPGDVKGTGFLTWDYDDDKRTDDKWLFLPAMKKTRRISGKSSKTNYFMGSDFTYNDMSQRSVDNEQHKLLREESLKDRKCWVVESKPKDKGEIYTSRVSWIDKETLLPLKIDFYDKLYKLHRRMTISNIDKIQGFWTMHEMEMKNIQTGHRTIVKIENQKFDVEINPNIFTVKMMEKGL